jgi:hypothetical protein
MRAACVAGLICALSAVRAAAQIDCHEGLRVVMPNDVGGTVLVCDGTSATVATDDGWFGHWPTADLFPALAPAPSARPEPVVGHYRCVGPDESAAVELTFDQGDIYRDAAGRAGQVEPAPDGTFALADGPMDGYLGRQSFGMLVLTAPDGAALTCSLRR